MMRPEKRFWPLAVIALMIVGLVSGCRALGFGEGLTLAATPASGMALGAAVLLRTPGAISAALGFALAGVLWGLPSDAVATDAISHGAAALIASVAMRSLARRREARSRTSDWLIFLTGTSVFATVVAVGLALGAAAGALGPATPAEAPLYALVFEPLGILTFGAVLASLRELPLVAANPRPAAAVLALAATLLGALWLLLSLPIGGASPSGVTLVLSVPFCLWVAMQRRSLDGAALSFFASHLVLILLLDRVGSIDRSEFVTAIVYLNLLVATCQLVHAVNRDRLAALFEVEARVAERTARLKAMAERALEADAAKTRFLATVSHEVRTPLNGVIGMANVVLTGHLDARTRRNIEIIRTSGHHMLDVINRILDFARIGQACRADERGEFDLRAVVEEVLDEARFLPYAEDLALLAEFEAGLETGRMGYGRGLRQVLTNLVGNAAKFTNGGSVTVRVASLPDGLVRIEVEDTGVGIAPDDLERIFLPYEQAETGRSGPTGTGLGLAICAEVVRRMGGSIGVESSVGSGSVFWVELPLSVAKAQAELGPA